MLTSLVTYEVLVCLAHGFRSSQAKGTEKKPTQASFDARYLIALRTLHAFLGIPDEEYKLTIYIAVLNKSIHGPGRGLSSKLWVAGWIAESVCFVC
jgi:hypothetical protein